MTSNIGSQYILDEDATEVDIKRKVQGLLKEYFKPEFLNRVDEIIIFHRLGKEHLKQIIEIQLNRLRKMLMDRKVEIETSESLKDFLVENGYDPAFGARPLKRLIQKEIQDRLAAELLSGNIKDGSKVIIDFDKNKGKVVICNGV